MGASAFAATLRCRQPIVSRSLFRALTALHSCDDLHVYASQVPYGAPCTSSYWWSVLETANVWEPEVRVLWLHSAAWIAVLVLAGEQAGLAGREALVLEVAGLRVAVARVVVRARASRKLGESMLVGWWVGELAEVGDGVGL